MLKNKIITSNAIIEENEEELSLLEYATKKLNKAKEDSKAVENHKKIVKLLQEYEAKDK